MKPTSRIFLVTFFVWKEVAEEFLGFDLVIARTAARGTALASLLGQVRHVTSLACALFDLQ